MAELYIPLRLTAGIAGIYFTQLRGKDELAVEDVSTATVLSLLQGLMAKGNDKNPADFSVARIVTADRDRILAHLYVSVYGSHVESTLQCIQCKERFSLEFSIIDLLEHYQLSADCLSEDGTCSMHSGCSFRLPTGEDELLLPGFSQQEAGNFLLERCLINGNLENDGIIIQKKMSEIAPVLNIDMKANCPECGCVQQARFDIQSFLLTKLKQERPLLIREIHRIAVNYHWTQDAILDLPRKLRKQYVALTESDT